MVHTGGTLFNKSESDTLGLREGDKGLLVITDHENVTETGGERVTFGVLDVGDLV